MSDRIKAFTVVLDQDYKDDDADRIQQALSYIKGVLEVTPVVTNIEDYINRERIRSEYVQKFTDILYPARTMDGRDSR